VREQRARDAVLGRAPAAAQGTDGGPADDNVDLKADAQIVSAAVRTEAGVGRSGRPSVGPSSGSRRGCPRLPGTNGADSPPAAAASPAAVVSAPVPLVNRPLSPARPWRRGGERDASFAHKARPVPGKREGARDGIWRTGVCSPRREARAIEARAGRGRASARDFPPPLPYPSPTPPNPQAI
jgi:hypothetical protein